MSDDEGAIDLNVSVDTSDGLIHIDFGKPILALELNRQQATAFALLILRHSADRCETLDLPDAP